MLIVMATVLVACGSSIEEWEADSIAGAERTCFGVADSPDATVQQVENSALYRHCLATKTQEIRAKAADMRLHRQIRAQQPPTVLGSAYLGAKRALGIESPEQREAREEAQHAARVKQAQAALIARVVERSPQLKRERGHGMTKAEYYILARQVFAAHGLELDISDADIAAAKKEQSVARRKKQ